MRKAIFLIIFILGALIFPSRGQLGNVNIQIQVVSPPPSCGDGSCNGSETCSSCSKDCGSCPSIGGGGGGAWVPPVVETKVVLQGKAYPSSSITILKDGQVSALTQADSGANFKVELTTLTAGTYTFGVWGEDLKGRKSIVFSFTTSVSSGTITTVSGIFLPPTIELEETTLRRGEMLNIMGQTAPASEITVSIHSPEEIIKKTQADEVGFWDYPLDTIELDEGTHTSRAKATSPEGLLSSYSQSLSFNVGKPLVEGVCPNADLNGNGRVNLVDFSILLYWWGKSNACADQNQNGVVDLADFSVMMYWWTG